MKPEIREVPGLEGYGASADGRIWSRWKWGRRELTSNWREVAQRTKRGRRHMMARLGPVRAQRTYQVHRLVATAFIGPIPDGMVVNHKDGDPKNNRPENLEICTPQWNEIHAFLNGRKPKGEGHGNAIYSETTIKAIKEEYAAGGVTQRQLSEKHNVKLPTVQAVISGRMWKHV